MLTLSLMILNVNFKKDQIFNPKLCLIKTVFVPFFLKDTI